MSYYCFISVTFYCLFYTNKMKYKCIKIQIILHVTDNIKALIISAVWFCLIGGVLTWNEPLSWWRHADGANQAAVTSIHLDTQKHTKLKFKMRPATWSYWLFYWLFWRLIQIRNWNILLIANSILEVHKKNLNSIPF